MFLLIKYNAAQSIPFDRDACVFREALHIIQSQTRGPGSLTPCHKKGLIF